MDPETTHGHRTLDTGHWTPDTGHRTLDTIFYIVLSAAFGLASYALRFLNVSGAVVASLFGLSILELGGPEWAAPPLAFFVLSSILSTGAKRLRPVRVREQVRGGRRDAIQVLANGGIGWMVLIVFAAWPAPDLYWIYAASFSAAAADTWATEVGMAVAGRTVSIVSGREVEPGVSGGVSASGTVASVLGAVSVFGISFVANPTPLIGQATLAVLGGGIIGSLLDSFLGATLQGVYSDERGSITESPGAPDRPNRLERGHTWLNNDSVNALCTVTGAAIAAAILYA